MSRIGAAVGMRFAKQRFSYQPSAVSLKAEGFYSPADGLVGCGFGDKQKFMCVCLTT